MKKRNLSIILSILLLFCGVSLGRAQQWEYVTSGLTSAYTYDIGFNGDYVFAATNSGVFRSSNQGGAWQKTPGNEFCHGLEVIDGVVYAMHTDGVKRSSDNGTSWTSMLNTQVRAITKINGSLFVAGSGGVQKSTNNGATWSFSNGALFSDGSNGRLMNTNAFSLVVQGTDMYVGTFGGDNGGIFISRDYGQHWMLWENNGKKYVWDMLATGSAVFAGVSNDLGPMGILKCTNRVNWSSANVGVVNPYVQCLGAYGSVLYAGNMANTPQGAVGGAYRSTNGGTSWELLNQGLTGYDIYAIQSNGTFVFIANWNKGVARYPVAPMVTEGRLEILLRAEDPWGLAGPSAHVKLYAPNGDLVEDKWANAKSTAIFEGLAAGTYTYKVYNARITPWGEQYWGQGSLTIAAGLTTNLTYTHNTPFLPTQRVYNNQTGELLSEGGNALIQAGTQLRIEADVTHGTYPGTVSPTSSYVSIYLDRDQQLPYDIVLNSTLQPYTAGQTRTVVFFPTITHNGSYSMTIGCYSQSTAYPSALTDGGGWLDKTFQIVNGTAVEQDPQKPTQFALRNYPNPFNPETTIEYAVPEGASVTLKVVDILGREAVLINGVHHALGTYSARWTAPTTGTYIAVLELGTGTGGPSRCRTTVKMMALK
jgi:hypothetical protein